MTQTIADDFHNDPRVAQARRLLIEAMTEHQAKLTGPRDASDDLKSAYQKLVQQFGDIRGGKLYYPYLGSGIGRGCLVELADGSVKYDMIGGIGTHYFGHSDPTLIAAGIDAAVRDTVMQGNLQQNVEIVRLSRTLLDIANRRGAMLAHCFLSTSGAMANENAFKLIFARRHPADRVLAFEHCFAGRTIAMASVTDKAAYRQGLPSALRVDYVPFFNPDAPQESTRRALAAIDEHLARYPGKHAGMIFELIQGEGGYYAGDATFFRALMTHLKKQNITVLVDEIQTFGRTTEPFAFQYHQLDDLVDVVTVGKLTQACATLFTDTHLPPAGLISQTFTAGTAVIAAAQCILDRMMAGDLFGSAGRIATLSEHVRSRLRAIADKHPDWIAGPYGEGAMIAFTPFDGSAARAKTLLDGLYDAGVIAFITGANPARVRMLPPMAVVTVKDIDAVGEILEATLAKVA